MNNLQTFQKLIFYLKHRLHIRLQNVQIWSVLYRYEGLRTAHRSDLHLYVKVYTFDSFVENNCIFCFYL